MAGKTDAHQALAFARFLALDALFRELYLRLDSAELHAIKQKLLAAYDRAPIKKQHGMDGDWIKHHIIHHLEGFFSIVENESAKKA